MKMTGDYEDHCGDNEMIGDYKTVVTAKTTVVLDVTPCVVGGHGVCIFSSTDTGSFTPLGFTTLRGTCMHLQVATRPGCMVTDSQ